MGVIGEGVAAPRQQEEGQRAWSEMFRLNSNVSPPNRAHSATLVFASRSRDGRPQHVAEEAAARRVRRLALRDLVLQVVDLHVCPRLRELASGACNARRARLACVPGCATAAVTAVVLCATSLYLHVRGALPMGSPSSVSHVMFRRCELSPLSHADTNDSHM